MDSSLTESQLLSKRVVYRELKEPFLSLEKSFKSSNNHSTYVIADDFLSKFDLLLGESKRNLEFVSNYIEFNIVDDNNINTYNDLLTECKNDVVKLDSFIKRTRNYFEGRKNMFPFIMSKETIDIINKAIKKLILVYGESYSFMKGVKSDGVNYLVNLL